MNFIEEKDFDYDIEFIPSITWASLIVAYEFASNNIENRLNNIGNLQRILENIEPNILMYYLFNKNTSLVYLNTMIRSYIQAIKTGITPLPGIKVDPSKIYELSYALKEENGYLLDADGFINIHQMNNEAYHTIFTEFINPEPYIDDRDNIYIVTLYKLKHTTNYYKINNVLINLVSIINGIPKSRVIDNILELLKVNIDVKDLIINEIKKSIYENDDNIVGLIIELNKIVNDLQY